MVLTLIIIVCVWFFILRRIVGPSDMCTLTYGIYIYIINLPVISSHVYYLYIFITLYAARIIVFPKVKCVSINPYRINYYTHIHVR